MLAAIITTILFVVNPAPCIALRIDVPKSLWLATTLGNAPFKVRIELEYLGTDGKLASVDVTANPAGATLVGEINQRRVEIEVDFEVEQAPASQVTATTTLLVETPVGDVAISDPTTVVLTPIGQ